MASARLRPTRAAAQSAKSVSASDHRADRQHALPLPRGGHQRRGRRARARPQLRHAAQPAGHHRLRLTQPRALERLDHGQREGHRAGRRRHDRGAGAPGLPLRRPVLPGGDQGGREQRLVLLQGRPAVGDGPPAPDHAHDDRRRQPDRRGPQRAARRPARAPDLRRARAPAGFGQPRGAQRPRHAAEALAQGSLVAARRAGVHPLAGARSRYMFTVRRRGSYRVVVLPRDHFAHVRGASREVTLRR